MFYTNTLESTVLNIITYLKTGFLTPSETCLGGMCEQYYEWKSPHTTEAMVMYLTTNTQICIYGYFPRNLGEMKQRLTKNS